MKTAANEGKTIENKPTYDNFRRFLDFLSDEKDIYGVKKRDDFLEHIVEFVALYKKVLLNKSIKEIEGNENTTVSLRYLRSFMTKMTNATKKAFDVASTEEALVCILVWYLRRSRHVNFLNASERKGEA